MKLGTLVLLLTLVTAPACGGGSADSGIGNSPSLSASFVPEQPRPAANTVAMLEASKSNDVVNVLVTLSDTPGVFAAAFEVVFNDAQATYLGFGRGAAFEMGGNVPNYTVDGSSNPGRIVIGVARTDGTTTSIVGLKAIVTLQFRVKEAGTAPITLQNGIVYDGQSTPQPIPGILWFAGAVVGV